MTSLPRRSATVIRASVPEFEFQAIRLDAVAENNTILRHERSKA